MASFHLRFVGASSLPKSLSKIEIDESFCLSDGDITVIRSRFRGIGRLGAAIQLVVVRATGRGLDAVSGIPKALLVSLSQAVGSPTAELASLKSLYSRVATRFDHQRWAREHAGFQTFDAAAEEQLASILAQLSTSAVSINDLVKQVEVWLFEQRYVLPGERVLAHAAGTAFATQDADSLRAIQKNVPARELKVALSRLSAKRMGRSGSTVLEWLRTPPAKHGVRTLGQSTSKVAFLKTLRVHEWNLRDIPLARLQGYRDAVLHRPPSDTFRLSEDRKQLELASFLYLTLLDLTDAAIDMAARRVNDLRRSASSRVEQKRASSANGMRLERNKIQSVLYSERMTDTQKIAALKALISEEGQNSDGTRAALMRQALVEEEAPRVSALLNGLALFDLQGDPQNRAIRQIQTLRDLAERHASTLPPDFDLSMVDSAWLPLVSDPDRKRALSALRACAMSAAYRGVKGGQLWLPHSRKHRNREDQLIPSTQWIGRRSQILSSMHLTGDADKYVARVLEKLSSSLEELAAATEQGRVTIDEKGHLHLPPIEALDLPPEVDRTRDAMFEMIGPVQHGQLLVQIDAKTGFSETLLGRKAKSREELTAVYGALLSHGTDNDVSGVAQMIPGIQISHIVAAMRSMEAQGRLASANARITEFQQSLDISKLWGLGDKASADSMTMDTSRHLHSARMEYRRKQPGIGIYTHVRDSYGLFYNQPIVLNDRQAAGAVHGVEAHNVTRREDQIKLSLLAVDTHGYTNAAMAIAKLLQFDLCVRLRQLSERMLYLPASVELPEALDRAKIGKVNLKHIKSGWDDLLRMVASIREGHLTAREALERLGSAAKGERMHMAAEALGKLLRTIFLCDYFSKPPIRREMHTLLNRGESVHLLQRAVHQGRIGTSRGRRHEELWAISGAHTLLTNAVIAWNTLKMQEVVDDWKGRKHPIDQEWLRHMGPVHFRHINFRGTIAFDLEAYSHTLLQRGTRVSREAAR